VDRLLMAARRAWLLLLVGLVASPLAAAAEDAPSAEAPVELPVDGEAPGAEFLCAAAAPGLLVRLRDLSAHNDGRILLWAWDFGDGTTYEAQTRSANPTEHAFAEPGTYTVTLTVYDRHGDASRSSRTCTALPAAPVAVVLPPPADRARVATGATDDAGADPDAVVAGVADDSAADTDPAAAAGTAEAVADGVEAEGGGADAAAAVTEEAVGVETDAATDVVESAAVVAEGAVEAVEDALDDAVAGLVPAVGRAGCVDLLLSCDVAAEQPLPETRAVAHATPAPDGRMGAGTVLLSASDDGKAGPGSPDAQAQVAGAAAVRPVADVAAPVGAEGGAASAAAGLTAVAVVGFLAVGPWRRLLRGLVLTPLGALFTRIKGDELLEHPLRAEIVQAVETEPGIHYQALVRAVGKGNGVLEHHLRMLTSAGLLKERAAAGYTCYFPAATDRRMMDVHAVLKSSVARRVLDVCMERPGNAIGELAKSVGVTPKAVTYHLNRFEDVGLVRTERSGRSVLVYANPLALHAAPVTAAVSSAA